MLMQSNKNNPIEVVTILLSLNPQSLGSSNNLSTFGGVLTKLEHDLVRPTKNTSQMARKYPEATALSPTTDHGSETTEKTFEKYSTSNKDRQNYQQAMINRMRTSDDNLA
jgi:hypothetical protein